LETPFDLFMTQLSFCFVQEDRINDFVTFDLSGDKRGVHQFVVTEFHVLPSANVLIHSSFGIFVTPQTSSVGDASRFSVKAARAPSAPISRGRDNGKSA
jgi:hypothetical protein